MAGCFGAFTVLVLAGGAGAGSDKGRMAEITKKTADAPAAIWNSPN
ncbi:hypothetical protein QW131_22095 [Roseibium salinum]|nr:hypothetical protein [Roseibium salinum]